MYRYSCMWKITPKEVLFALLKGPTTNLKKSFGGKSFSRNVLTKKHRKAAKKTQVFCREKYHKKYRWNHKKKKQKKNWVVLRKFLVHGKKKSAFLNCVRCWSKYIQWVLVGKIVYRANDFLLSEMKCIYFLNNRRCSNSQKFFSSRQPSIREKK